MPLAPPILQSALEALFAEPPLLVAECADAWGSAVGDYATAIIPASTTVGAAAASLTAALAAAFATPVAAPAFDAAMMAFAVAVGGGMAPFAGTPPPAPLGIAALLAASQPTHAAAAVAFTTQIDAWFRTGSAALIAPPFTVIPAWS